MIVKHTYRQTNFSVNSPEYMERLRGDKKAHKAAIEGGIQCFMIACLVCERD